MVKKDMGMALLVALPSRGRQGSIKTQAWEQLAGKRLRRKRGLRNLMKFIHETVWQEEFKRLLELNNRHVRIK